MERKIERRLSEFFANETAARTGLSSALVLATRW